jgi:hypothetical protein
VWSPLGPEYTKLQGHLLQLVEDMQKAGIQVLLDILCLQVGMDINEFMCEGIELSNFIFWISIKFKEDSSPDNPAIIEFVHTKDKAKQNPQALTLDA